jgi:hypothetical protein
MSTMLRTINSDAVNEIDPHRDRRRPYQTQHVLFHSRPGEARMGRMVANAEILNIEDDDHVELLIKYSADDFIVRWKIPRRTEQNPYNSWSFNEWDEKHYRPDATAPEPPKPEGHLTWEDVKAMHAEMAVMRHKVVALEAKPKRAGGRDEPAVGV